VLWNGEHLNGRDFDSVELQDSRRSLCMACDQPSPLSYSQ